MKKCCICKEVKPFDEFHKAKTKDGRANQCKPCKRDYDKQYRKANWEKLSKQMQDYASSNPELIKEIRSRSKKKNAARRNAEWHNRYARIKGNGGSFTHDEWNDLCALFGNVCLSCGSDGPLTKDHVIPVTLGGKNTIDNLQPLCQTCNSRKGAKIIDYR